jgi:hypothetical protein
VLLGYCIDIRVGSLYAVTNFFIKFGHSSRIIQVLSIFVYQTVHNTPFSAISGEASKECTINIFAKKKKIRKEESRINKI